MNSSVKEVRGFTDQKIRAADSGTAPSAVTASEPSAVWIQPVIDKLNQLSGLPYGWDSYQARPLNASSALNAFVLLQQVMMPGVPTPVLVPTIRGNIQIEWHVRDIDLEIEVGPDVERIVAFEDAETGDAWETTLTTDLRPIVRALRILACRQ